jgi:hypothetical protein
MEGSNSHSEFLAWICGKSTHSRTEVQFFFFSFLQVDCNKPTRKTAIDIQRCWRGFKGREHANAVSKNRDRELRMNFFNKCATIIQKMFVFCFVGFSLLNLNKLFFQLAGVPHKKAARLLRQKEIFGRVDEEIGRGQTENERNGTTRKREEED